MDDEQELLHMVVATRLELAKSCLEQGDLDSADIAFKAALLVCADQPEQPSLQAAADEARNDERGVEPMLRGTQNGVVFLRASGVGGGGPADRRPAELSPPGFLNAVAVATAFALLTSAIIVLALTLAAALACFRRNIIITAFALAVLVVALAGPRGIQPVEQVRSALPRSLKVGGAREDRRAPSARAGKNAGQQARLVHEPRAEGRAQLAELRATRRC